MPELPEVEIVARTLREILVGQRVVTARLIRPRLAPFDTPAKFARVLKGRRVNSVGRRGKFIVVDFENDYTLIVHLRMTGRFSTVSGKKPLPKYCHALFNLESGIRLLFEDQRHFGFMRLVKSSEFDSLPEIARLAPEPWSDKFTPIHLYGTLQRTSRSVKQVLLDQDRVLGLGNIYAAEALFRSKINPVIQARDISKRKVTVLHKSILEVLSEAITANEAELVNGEMLSQLEGRGKWQVYGRESEKCFKCAAVIARVVQGGRSTYYCPRCQRG